MIKGHILIISYFKLEHVGNNHKTSQKSGLATAERNLKSPTLWLCQNSYWKWPLIVDFSSYKMVIFHSYVSLPEGIFTKIWHAQGDFTLLVYVIPTASSQTQHFFFTNGQVGIHQHLFCRFSSYFGAGTFTKIVCLHRRVPGFMTHSQVTKHIQIIQGLLGQLESRSNLESLNFTLRPEDLRAIDVSGTVVFFRAVGGCPGLVMTHPELWWFWPCSCRILTELVKYLEFAAAF